MTTSRERLRQTLNHEQPDQVVMDLAPQQSREFMRMPLQDFETHSDLRKER